MQNARKSIRTELRSPLSSFTKTCSTEAEAEIHPSPECREVQPRAHVAKTHCGVWDRAAGKRERTAASTVIAIANHAYYLYDWAGAWLAAKVTVGAIACSRTTAMHLCHMYPTKLSITQKSKNCHQICIECRDIWEHGPYTYWLCLRDFNRSSALLSEPTDAKFDHS